MNASATSNRLCPMEIGRAPRNGTQPRILPARVSALAFASCLCGVLVASTQVSCAEESIEALEEKFAAAYERIHQPVWELTASFTAALERLFAQETAAGNLDGALEIQNEIKAFGDGRDYDPETFLRRPAATKALADAKDVYSRERDRLWNESRNARSELLSHYATALIELERQLTQDSNLPAALKARQARESLDHDPRFAKNTKRVFDQRPFPARVHIVAKGDIHLAHNGSRLTFRNTSSERAKYVYGSTRDIMASAGDIIHLNDSAIVASM